MASIPVAYGLVDVPAQAEGARAAARAPMMARMTHAAGPATLIVSPLASRIRDDAVRARVVARTVDALRRRGHEDVRVVETGTPGELATAALAAVQHGATMVAIAGGDGTVRDAAGPLIDTDVDVGIVPCGTGNLYAGAVGVPRTLDAAIAALATGRPRAYDIGRVHLISPPGAPSDATLPAAAIDFGVACGTGFDARMIASTSREMKRRYSVAAYFLAAARLLPTLAPQATVLEVDGVRTELESVVVLVANCGEALPGLLRPRLALEPDDGLLHVFVLARGGLVGGLRGALELLNADSHGVSPSGHAMRLVGTEVRVEVTPVSPTQVDGDAFPPAWLEASIRPGGLRIIRP